MINPKLLALAKKIDAANEFARRLEALQHEDDTVIERAAKEELCAAAYDEIADSYPACNIPATNVEELALKARYGHVELNDETEWPGTGGLAIAAAVTANCARLAGKEIRMCHALELTEVAAVAVMVVCCTRNHRDRAHDEGSSQCLKFSSCWRSSPSPARSAVWQAGRRARRPRPC